MVHPQLVCYDIAAFPATPRWHLGCASRWKSGSATLFLPRKRVADPEWADTKYEEVVTSLREATRDTSRFPLVFAENANYGFRRNLWGLRPIGTAVAVVLFLISWTLLSLGHMGAALARAVVGRSGQPGQRRGHPDYGRSCKYGLCRLLAVLGKTVVGRGCSQRLCAPASGVCSDTKVDLVFAALRRVDR